MIYMLAWTGGYEPANYAFFTSLDDLAVRLADWSEDFDADRGDTFDIVEIDPSTAIPPDEKRRLGDSLVASGIVSRRLTRDDLPIAVHRIFEILSEGIDA